MNLCIPCIYKPYLIVESLCVYSLSVCMSVCVSVYMSVLGYSLIRWHAIQFGLYPQAISDAVDTLLPSLPPTLTSTLSVQGQPFFDSTFYLPYLPYAPQKALANIFSVYRRYLFGVTLSRYTVLHCFHVQYTILHITPCCTTYTAPYYTTLHCTLHQITSCYSTLHYIVLHHITPHYTFRCIQVCQ